MNILILLFIFFAQTALAQDHSKEKVVADSIQKLSQEEAQIDAYLYFAKNYFHEDIAYSKKLAEKALEMSETINYEKGKIKAYLGLAGYFTYNQANKAYIYFQKAEEVAQNISNYELLVEILEQKALYHVRWLQYGQAIICVQKATKIIVSERLNLEIPYETLAIILSKQGNYQQAIGFYKIVINHDRQNNEESNLSGIFSEMGNVYYRLQNYDSARWCYEEGLKIAKKYDQKRDLGYLYDNVGLSFYKQQKYQQALIWQKKGLEFRKKSHSDLDIIANLNNLGKTYLALKHYDSALSMANESFPKTIKFRNLFFLQEVNEVMADAFFGLKIADSAFLYQKNAYKYLDSLKQEQEKQAITGATAMIEAQKEITDNQILKKENQVLTIVGVLLAILFFTILATSLLIVRQNKSRKKLLKQLQQANQTKDHLFAIIAHDLKSPVTAFQMIFKQINYFIQKKQIERIESIGSAMNQSALSLAHLLDNLLNWALLQKQEIKANIQKIDLKDILNQIKSNYQELAKFLDIEISIEISEEIELNTDPHLLQTILRNLLNNSLKYTSEGGKVSLIAKKEADFVKIWIKDIGLGMSADLIKEIFDSELNKSKKGIRGESGTGLGLVLVHQFSQILNAKISIESQIGKGTSFLISLPNL
ncbi:MAG: hypothetical protein EAZ97_08020 [Bacteroidetes bacterium]|nr:MAG: hypothetical protein EAZ97_08020 [Bacteroidota bacterium]